MYQLVICLILADNQGFFTCMMYNCAIRQVPAKSILGNEYMLQDYAILVSSWMIWAPDSYIATKILIFLVRHTILAKISQP